MTGDYDLLILDIMLPDVNGWDIVARCAPPGKACRSCCLPRWAPLSIG
jgi:CheY-like chemotaxis protein